MSPESTDSGVDRVLAVIDRGLATAETDEISYEPAFEPPPFPPSAWRP